MVVECFSVTQPWGTAAAHQRDHPTAWTPELADSTEAWTQVVRAVVQAQQDLLAAPAPQRWTCTPSPFIARCASDAGLRSQLDKVCACGLHGLLISWVMEGVRERLANHAVPAFWRHYDREAASGGILRGGRPGVALQRRCQAAFFTAVHELTTHVAAQMQLIAIIEGKHWHDAASAIASIGHAPGAATPGGAEEGSAGGVTSAAQLASPLPCTSRCVELTTLLQAMVLAHAPEPHTFSGWLTVSWQRSFADLARSGAPAEEASAAAAGGGGGGDDDDDEEEDDDDDAWAEMDGAEDDGDGEDMHEEDAGRAMSVSRSPVSDMAVDGAGSAVGASSGPVEALRACCGALHLLGWLPMIEPTLSSMLHSRLHAALHKRCAGVFDERLLHRILGALNRGVTRWLRTVLMPSVPITATPTAELRQWLNRLRFFLMQALGTLRISELFDMIVDYPDSTPAIADLKECLSHTHQHADAVQALGDAIDRRLLKPGADTANIIQMYVSAIRALRQLDPTGVTLEAVSERVRIYLKERPDTIRQIVTSLTDPESSELLQDSGGGAGSGAGGEALDAEVLNDEASGLEASDMHGVDLDELRGDEAAMMAWAPDPVHADPARTHAPRRTSDVLSSLVNIYGSKAVFVNEFRAMLADKLLAASDYDTEREVRNLELLKTRFGEQALSSCEVMLRDIAESKRATQAIQKHFGHDATTMLLDATIVSRLCWPALASEDFEPPPKIKAEMSRFEKQFMHHKAPRKLVWKPSLGCVTIDVSFADKAVKGVKCSPIHATILHLFGEQPKWSLAELAAKLQMPSDAVKRKIVLWLNRGFIHEVSRTADGEIRYEAPTHLGQGAEARTQVADDDEIGGGSSSAEAQLEQDMKMYEQYIIGMLTNLESLPVGRIHNMLRMFVPASGGDRGYDRSEAELQRFLNRLVEDGKLEVTGGLFKIRREG